MVTTWEVLAYGMQVLSTPKLAEKLERIAPKVFGRRWMISSCRA
jgi:hypothetical protein